MKLFMDQIIKRTFIAGLTGLIVVTGCRQIANRSEQVSYPGIPVTVSPVHTGPMVNYIELSATSAFLFKAAIKAPVTGYIDHMRVNQGERVEKNQSLFTLRTKEADAILNDSLNTLKFNGIVNVKAATAGLIISIEHPQGDYVAEGEQLCQVAIPESFAFILDVPFELSGFVKLNTSCEIVLPDSQRLKGIVKSRFPFMSVSSQTERYIVRLAESKNLPENLTGKVRIVRESVKSGTSLPKSCILTDETMQQFWAMKLFNDSMAVRVPVTIGITDGDYVQITQPVFNTSDLFLATGNYGLGDTVYVKVLK
jgi:hypothetical protein